MQAKQTKKNASPMNKQEEALALLKQKEEKKFVNMMDDLGM